MKIFLDYNNILCDNCMKMNFHMIVQFYKLNLFKRIQKVIFIKKYKIKRIIKQIIPKIKLFN